MLSIEYCFYRTSSFIFFRVNFYIYFFYYYIFVFFTRRRRREDIYLFKLWIYTIWVFFCPFLDRHHWYGLRDLWFFPFDSIFITHTHFTLEWGKQHSPKSFIFFFFPFRKTSFLSKIWHGPHTNAVTQSIRIKNKKIQNLFSVFFFCRHLCAPQKSRLTTLIEIFPPPPKKNKTK